MKNASKPKPIVLNSPALKKFGEFEAICMVFSSNYNRMPLSNYNMMSENSNEVACKILLSLITCAFFGLPNWSGSDMEKVEP